MIERRTVEELEAEYGVEMTNETLSHYHSGQWSAVYRCICGRWPANDDEVLRDAVQELDSYLDGADIDPLPPGVEAYDVNMALAWRATLASDWNKQQFPRADELGPIERR